MITLIEYDTTDTLGTLALENLRAAVKEVFNGATVQFKRVPNAPLYFGVTAPAPHELATGSLVVHQSLTRILRAYTPDVKKNPWGGRFDHSTVLYLDIETDSGDLRWNLPLPEFFRLGQFAFGPDSDVVITSDYREVLEACAQANGIVAHNGHQFDFSVLLGDKALELALDNRLFDTMVYANLVFPAPKIFTMRNGNKVLTEGKPEAVSRWLSLDNLAFKLDVPGKEGDLKALAKKHGGFGLIPVDDPEYLAYAEQDVHLLRNVSNELLHMHEPTSYDWREQLKSAIDAQMSRNGFTVNVPAAQERIAELAERKAELMVSLVAEYGLPSEGKMPWRTTKGKAAVIAALAKAGIDPNSIADWPKLKTGPSLSGPVIVEFTKGTNAEEFGIALAELQGQRSLAEQALTYTQNDGKMHPDINGWQMSGRRCLPDTHQLVTKRGLLYPDEIVPGDQTLDMRNRWVPVNQVYRYKGATIHRYENRSVTLESTPEHRWVQNTAGGFWSDRTVEPLDTESRKVLQLTPDATPFDPKDVFADHDMTYRERLVALVALLVTDGTAKQRTDSSGGTFRIYQTEGKFYRLILDTLPDSWVMRDTDRGTYRSNGKHCKTPLHEIALHSNLISELLEAEGLSWRDGLRHSNTLLPWVLSLTQRETEVFFRFVYLADGRVAVGGGAGISTLNPNTANVFAIAAYRCGLRPKYYVYVNHRGEKSGLVALRRDRVNTRGLGKSRTEEYVSDVWCVETESGTFTAWGPDGVPYLTGNSVTHAGLTTWGERNPRDKRYLVASPGRKLVEFDLSNADQRIVAAFSRDPEYAKRFVPGADGHEISGRLMYGNSVYDSNPEFYRKIAKALSHAWSYGSGAKTLARTAKQPVELAERFISAMRAAYPVLITWQDRVRADGAKGYVINHWGRRILVDKDRAYTQAPAAHGQSGTTEVLYDGLIKMARRDIRLIHWLVCPIHDAILMDIPEDEVEYARASVDECMTQTINGIAFPVSSGPAGDTWESARH